jgi:hypothetical protein
MLSPWALFVVCAVLGAIGLGISYKQRWAAVVPVAAVLALVMFTIFRLRDPFSIPPEYQGVTQDWSYVAALFWSAVVGTTLPLLGKYLRSRKKS